MTGQRQGLLCAARRGAAVLTAAACLLAGGAAADVAGTTEDGRKAGRSENRLAQSDYERRMRRLQAPYRDPKTGTPLPVIRFKQLLDELGYDPGPRSQAHQMPLDMFINPRTTKSIRRFQRDHDLKPDGRMSLELLKFMAKSAEDRRKARYARVMAGKKSYSAGYRYYRGRSGHDRNWPQARKHLRKAAELGNLQAMNLYGRMLQDGEGGPKDVVAAARWYKKSADRQNAVGEVRLGVMYRDGLGVPPDPKAALRLFLKSAGKGYPKGAYHAAKMYRSGAAGEQDDAQALMWLKRAGHGGHIAAEMELGAAYEQGSWLPRDMAKALKWYTEAAKRRHPRALIIVGMAYLQPDDASAARWGAHAARDYKQALKWFRTANRNNPEVQARLGQMHEHGWGVVRDRDKAIRYYRRAPAASRHPLAAARLKALGAER